MALGGRKDRVRTFRQVSPLGASDHRNLEATGVDKFVKSTLTRKQRRKAEAAGRRLAQAYRSVLISIKETGAGFPVDRILHDLCIEYTHRYAASGIYNQPLNFNYFEAFCEIKLHENAPAPYATPVREYDHLFSIVDFFEYTTSHDSEGFSLDTLMTLPENTAFHFTSNGDVNAFSFLAPSGREFVISGYSMVRRGNYVSWYIVGGEIFTEDTWKEITEGDYELDLGQTPEWKKRFLSDAMKAVGSARGKPTPLQGTTLTQRVVIVGEIDVINGQHLGRCYMTEWENSFEVVCDDPSIVDDVMGDSDRKSFWESFHKKIEKLEVMWRIGESLLQLPSYFAFKVQISNSIAVASGMRLATHTRKGGRGIGGYYKTVSAIDIVPDQQIPIREYAPKIYPVNTSGYWRRIAATSKGTGPHGETVVGRTWIANERPKVAPEDTAKTIYVKSTIASAKLAKENHRKVAEAASLKVESGEKGITNVLYVLRCTIMDDEVYKVGWTSGTAESRAKQISAATGVPRDFVVVNEWPHPDPEALETNIHAMLDCYRISDNREFFKVEYTILKTIIENEISRKI